MVNNVFYIEKSILYLNPFIKPIYDDGMVRYSLMVNRELLQFAEDYLDHREAFEFELAVMEKEGLVLLIGVEDDPDDQYLIQIENKDEIAEWLDQVKPDR